MAQESEKSRITEIHVRMDCNGCVQKIKKALHGVNGISEQYIDVPQQKITIIGWADPEKIVKAIKKTRKSAVVCCQTEPLDPPEQSSHGDGGDPVSKSPPPPPSGESANPPPTEPASTEQPPAEPPNDPPPPPSENPKPEANSPRHTDSGSGRHEPNYRSRPKDVEEIHVIYHHPPDYGYRYPPAPPPPPPEYRYRYDFDDKIGGQGYTRQMYSYQSSPGYIPSRYQTTDGPDASIPEPLSKRYGGQWDSSYSNRPEFVPERPPNKRYGEEWQSYPSNARSTPPEPPTNPRDGGQRNSYPSNARSTPPEPPTNPRDGGQRHSYPSNARSTTPEPLSNPRDEKQWHSYPSNARSTTLEPPSDPRDGRQRYPYHTGSGPERGPQLRSQYSSSGLRSTVGTQQLYSGGPQPRMETPQPVNVTHSYNTHRPSPYVTGYEYVRAPPPYYSNYTGPERYTNYTGPERYTNYTGPERYTEDYHYGNTGNGNVTSIFSDENPNSCRII